MQNRQRPRRQGFPIFFIGIVLVLVEVWAIVRVGYIIGPGATILMILCTTAFGTWLARTQWAGMAARMQAQLAAGAMPQHVMGDSLGILFAAILLILPGFITDLAGLLLFLPPVRRWAATKLLDKLTRSRHFQSFGGGFGMNAPGGFDNSGNSENFQAHASAFSWSSTGKRTSTRESYENGLHTIEVTVVEPNGTTSHRTEIEEYAEDSTSAGPGAAPLDVSAASRPITPETTTGLLIDTSVGSGTPEKT